MKLVRCLLDCIMHSDDTQVIHNLARLVRSLHLDLVHNTRLDHVNSPLRMCSRDRSRRT